MQTTGVRKPHPVPHFEEYIVTRKGALNVLTEAVERASTGAGTGIRDRPLSVVKRMEVAEALRKLARMVYGSEVPETIYPIRVAEAITPSESERQAESRE